MKKTGSSKKIRKSHGRKPHSRAVRGLVIVAISLLSVMSLFLISLGVMTLDKIGLVKFGPHNSEDFVDSLIPDDESEGEEISDYTEIEEGAASVSEISVRGNTESVTNILLVGVDSRTGAYTKTLSDTVIILTIDRKKKAIKMTSLMRDTLITIPGRDRNGDGRDDYAKLNAPYSYGGFDLLTKTIEQNFRLNIDKHITINFKAFESTVDALGGIDIELSSAEARLLNLGNSRKSYHLDGRNALEYARIRRLDSDFQRTERQRKVMKVLFKNAKKMSIGKLNGVLDKVLPQVRTNMSPNEFTVLIFNSLTYFGYNMDPTFRIPPDKEFSYASIKGIGSVLVLDDPAKTVTELHKFIYM